LRRVLWDTLMLVFSCVFEGSFLSYLIDVNFKIIFFSSSPFSFDDLVSICSHLFAARSPVDLPDEGETTPSVTTSASPRSAVTDGPDTQQQLPLQVGSSTIHETSSLTEAKTKLNLRGNFCGYAN
jgi:hypothetical protein